MPYENRLFQKPVEPNAATNMTVITNKNKYYFKLNSSGARASKTLLVRLVYPNTNITSLGGGAGTIKAHLGFAMEHVHLDYATSSDMRTIHLSRARDATAST